MFRRTRFIAAVLVLAASFACRSAPRYVASSVPIDLLGGLNPPKLCIAVDQTDPQGVWWWHPGRSGCSSRSSSVMHAWAATVISPAPPSPIQVRFQIPVKIGAPRDIAFAIEDGLLVLSSGAKVPTEQRRDLNVPEKL